MFLDPDLRVMDDNENEKDHECAFEQGKVEAGREQHFLLSIRVI
jgi:hypothetical protein